MSDDLHNIDDLFKKALEEHIELPSSAVWNNIDKSLDKKKVVSISKKYNKLQWAVAVLLLFSVGMAMYVLHVDIKNRELVRENNAAKNLKKPIAQANSHSKDATLPAKKDSRGIKNEKVSQELKNDENNNDVAVNRDKKMNLHEDKNTVDNSSVKNKPGQHNTLVKSLFLQKGRAPVIKQNQNKSLLKNKPATEIQGQFAVVDLVNKNRKEDPVNSSVSSVSNNDDIAVNKQPGEKSNDKLVSPVEEYAHGIQLISRLKDISQKLLTSPISQIAEMPANKIAALKGSTNVPVKHNRTMALKQRLVKTGSSPLSATIFFSPDLVVTNVENDHPDFREEDSHEIKKDEKIRSSYTIGVLLDYATGKKWKLESGVTFSTRVTNIDPKTIYARPDNNGNINYRFNCSAGYSFVTLKSSGLPPVSGDSIKALTSKNVLHYIGIPFVLKYTVGTGRFSITPAAGISANFLTRGKIETTIPTIAGNESVTSNDIRGLRSTYFNGLASVGAQYKIAKNFELTFAPTIRFALSSINKNAPVKTYLNSTGLVGGIIIKL